MIIEWVAHLVLGFIAALLDVVSTFLPAVSSESVGQVLGWAMQFNGVFPVQEAISAGAAVLTWRLASGPVTAIIGRWTLWGRIW